MTRPANEIIYETIFDYDSRDPEGDANVGTDLLIKNLAEHGYVIMHVGDMAKAIVNAMETP